jgi:hypothetical protein
MATCTWLYEYIGWVGEVFSITGMDEVGQYTCAACMIHVDMSHVPNSKSGGRRLLQIGLGQVLGAVGGSRQTATPTAGGSRWRDLQMVRSWKIDLTCQGQGMNPNGSNDHQSMLSSSLLYQLPVMFRHVSHYT